VEGYDLEWEPMEEDVKNSVKDLAEESAMEPMDESAEESAEESAMDPMDVVPQLDEADEYEFVMLEGEYFIYSEKTNYVFNTDRSYAGVVGFFGDFIKV
jgi:hypothetical protein